MLSCRRCPPPRDSAGPSTSRRSWTRSPEKRARPRWNRRSTRSGYQPLWRIHCPQKDDRRGSEYAAGVEAFKGRRTTASTVAASCGSSHSSASRLSTQAPRAASSARFFCGPKPGQSVVSMTRAPSSRASSAVPSLLPLSTTMISSAKGTDPRQRRRRCASFLVMTTTDSRTSPDDACGSGDTSVVCWAADTKAHCRQRPATILYIPTVIIGGQSMNALTKRLRRIWPFFAPSRLGFMVAALCTIIVATTEPAVPWLMQQLLDRGFKGEGIPLWWVPVAVISLFAARAFAAFTSQYAVAWAAYRGTQAMRQALFRRMMDAHPELFTGHSTSALTNIVAHEAQGGAVMLSNSGLALVRDLLTLIALFVYLLWMNWQLTLFVGVLFPAVAYVMRVLSKRLHRLTMEGQAAGDHLAYTVEENVLAWRIVRLHSAQEQQIKRFDEMSDQMRRVAMKADVGATTRRPL